MAPCEDYPCCGHEPGDCPDSEGRFKCALCGVRMKKGYTSAACPRCKRERSRRHADEDFDYQED